MIIWELAQLIAKLLAQYILVNRQQEPGRWGVQWGILFWGHLGEGRDREGGGERGSRMARSIGMVVSNDEWPKISKRGLFCARRGFSLSPGKAAGGTVGRM